MSKNAVKTLRSPRARSIAADRLFNRPWAIRQSALAALVAEFHTAPFPGDDDGDEDIEHDFPVTEDGIACIPISGVLTKAPYWRGTSYGEVQQMCAAADSDPHVKAVLLCFDSPGGEASGMFELTDALYSLRGSKPLAGIADDQCYSAAYSLASAMDRLFVTRVGGVGSIGCWTAHVDVSEMMAKEGVKVTYVYAGAKKVDGNPYQPLSERARTEMQEDCDRIRGMFVTAVARNRAVSADALLETEAGCYTAEKALPLLADAVGGMGDALAYLRGRIAGGSPAADANAGGDSGSPFDAAAAAAPLAALLPIAFGRGACGWADHVYSEAESTALFGQPGVILAVRSFAGCRATVPAADAATRRITMLAVPYDGELSSNVGGFREVYQRGAFAEGLGTDLYALFDHTARFVLGRKSASTARFWEDAEGVHVECDPPDAGWANDLLVSMRRGDITHASAAFWILKSHMETRGGERVRVVEKALLQEASVRPLAAYETTQASVQPAAEAAAQHVVTELDRARLELLKLR